SGSSTTIERPAARLRLLTTRWRIVVSQARQFVPGWKRWNDFNACIIVSCTTSSASARFRTNHIARRNRRSACGNTSPSNAVQALEASRDTACFTIEDNAAQHGSVGAETPAAHSVNHREGVEYSRPNEGCGPALVGRPDAASRFTSAAADAGERRVTQ